MRIRFLIDKRGGRRGGGATRSGNRLKTPLNMDNFFRVFVGRPMEYSAVKDGYRKPAKMESWQGGRATRFVSRSI